MKRPWQIWLIFAFGLALVFAVMGWLSAAALRLERSEATARTEAAMEENVRLALWRMESALGPLLARESARPYFDYRAFHPAERAYTNMFAPIAAGEVLIPSPLLTMDDPLILIHFQFEPDGRLTSPQVPPGNMRDLAEMERGGKRLRTGEMINAAAARLGALEGILNRDRLAAALAREIPARQAGDVQTLGNYRLNLVTPRVPSKSNIQTGPIITQKSVQVTQSAPLGDNDFQQRVLLNSANGVQVINLTQASAANPSPPPIIGLPHPLWQGERLLLARRVSINGEEYLQGCQLDAEAIRVWLLGQISDLLPEATLIAAPSQATSADEKRRLAALPFVLRPGTSQFAAPTVEGTPLRTWLGIAWAGLLVGAGAIAMLLLGALRLSERRGTFVSAVTHELRTPLTTLQMYSEMLAGDMIADPEKRRGYLETLRIEAARLGHLVENVMAFARLERGRAGGRLELVDLGELLTSLEARLALCARRCAMSIEIGIGDEKRIVGDTAKPSEDGAIIVMADRTAIEQILFNLVDNACKYAALPMPAISAVAATAMADRPIHLSLGRRGEWAWVRVADHGPGVAPEQAGRLFRPFHKSASQAANSAPGIGLGLALSRRLARAMGGDLVLCPQAPEGGACFELQIPAVK